MAALIKPQFEAGREKVGKKGVVTDPKVHLEVIVKVCLFAQETGFTIAGLDYSPIKGPEGNIEFLLFLKKKAENSKQLLTEEEITLMAQAVVEKAAAQLGENK